MHLSTAFPKTFNKQVILILKLILHGFSRLAAAGYWSIAGQYKSSKPNWALDILGNPVLYSYKADTRDDGKLTAEMNNNYFEVFNDHFNAGGGTYQYTKWSSMPVTMYIVM